MLYRLAKPSDAEALVRLNAAFNGVDDVFPEDVRRSLEASPEVVAVADSAGKVIGFCCAQVHRSFCYKTPVAEVTEMYVDEGFRRQGCATGMLRFLEEHLQSAYGVDEIHLLTGTENLAARSAYKKAGFAAKNEVYMVKEVPAKR